MTKNTNSARVVAWQQANRERYSAKLREWNLRTKYGLSIEDYEKLLASQHGACAICTAVPSSKRRLAVDHCHATGKIRGLLCHTCNNLLGVFETRKPQFEAYLLKGED